MHCQLYITKALSQTHIHPRDVTDRLKALTIGEFIIPSTMFTVLVQSD